MISMLQLLTLTVWVRFSVLADCWGPEGYFVCLFIKTWVQLSVRIKDWRMPILIKEMQDCSGKKLDAEPQNLTEEMSASGMCFSLLHESLHKFGPSNKPLNISVQTCSENTYGSLWAQVDECCVTLSSLHLLHIQIHWACSILGHKNPPKTRSSVSQCWHWLSSQSLLLAYE